MQLIDKRGSGTGSIDLKFRVDELGRMPFVLSQLQVHFVRESGSAANYVASLLVRRYTAAGPRYNNELRRLERAGVAIGDDPYDINYRVPDEELRDYKFDAGDQLWIQWTDPSSGAVGWGVTATMAVWNPIKGEPV